MAELWKQRIHEEIEVKEDRLGRGYENSEENARISHRQEYEQMHPLILSLLQQMVNPPMVSFKGSQRLQMPEHTANHPRDTSHSFQEYNSVEPLSLIHLFRIVPSRCIHGEPGNANHFHS